MKVKMVVVGLILIAASIIVAAMPGITGPLPIRVSAAFFFIGLFLVLVGYVLGKKS